MSTTGLVTSVTDELIEQLEALTCIDEGGAVLIHTDQVRFLLTELRRLRAENAELAQSLAESRANDQAAMGWLTSLRWASGDRGERMLPELVTHIEGLAKDAGRWRKAIVDNGYVIAYSGCPSVWRVKNEDTAMATQ